MKTFAQAVTSVTSLTLRPDKIVLIKEKINGAIKLISAAGLFPNDLWEEVYNSASTPSVNGQGLIYALTLPARTRRVAYVQDGVNLDQLIAIKDFQHILRNPMDSGLAYLAGGLIRVKLRQATTLINVGVYRYPADLVNDADTNWILEDMYDLVVDYTAAWVLTLLGEKEMSGRISALTTQQLQIMVLDRVSQLYTTA